MRNRFENIKKQLASLSGKRSHWVFLMALGFGIVALTSYANYAIAQYPGFSDPGEGQATGGGGGGLVPVIAGVDGGEIPTGASAQVVVRFRNEGSQPVKTGLIRLYPSSTVSVQTSLNQCEEEPLSPGAECAIALSVKGLQAGSWRVEMLMSHSGRARLVSATLSGTVEASGDSSQNLATDIEAIPDVLDFGSLASSQTLVQPVTLRNITSVPIDINELYVDSSEQAGYSLKSECKSLEPGQACIAIVTWSPQVQGRSSGVMVIDHTGPSALTSVSMGGEYSPQDVNEATVFPQAIPGKGLLVSSQTDIDFGTGIETESTMTLSLVNAGDAPLTLDKIRLSGSDSGLDFKDFGCREGLILHPIEACAMTISWSPTRIGAIIDDVQIEHTGARGVLVLPVRGEAATAVGKGQGAIVLSQPQTIVLDGDLGANDIERLIDDPAPSRSQSSSASSDAPSPSNPDKFVKSISNPASVLEGYKITSFSKDRAIINGPGGSRIVFDDEEIVLGGIPWYIFIQPNGIEFLHQGQRVLLLFDRSLSAINRVGSSSGSGSSSNDTDDDDDVDGT